MENTEYNIWEILGIEATKDESLITQAYRERLSQTNPEDKPEEFKQLRNAYEEALAYAKRPEELQGNDEEINEWLKKLNDIYDDFAKRKDVNNWRELFTEKVCQSVAGHMRVEDELLRFLMDKYFIGHDVYLCMDEHFSILERKEELYQKYPRDFINNIVINGILYPDILPMMMFIPGEDSDECQKYLDTYRAIGLNEESRDKVEELLSLKEKHPYGDAWVYVWKIRFEDPKYFADLEKIAYEYEDDLNIGMLLAGEYYYAKEYEKAEKECERLLEKHKDDIRLRRAYADVLEAQEKYDETMNEINEIIRLAGGEMQILWEMDERRKKLNPLIIERKLKTIEEDPDDIQAKIDLCWAYLENEMKDEVLALFETMKEDTPAFDYYNILSNLSYMTKDYEKGIEALKKLVKVIDELPEDTEKNIKRRKRKGEMYARIAYFDEELKDYESAMKAYEQALEYSEDKSSVLTGMIQMAFRKNDYELAKECAEKLISIKPDSVYGHAMLGYAHFYMHNDQEAYNMISRALDINGSDIGLYVMKIRILVRNEAYEQAENVVQYLESYDLKEDPSVLYARGLLSSNRDNDKAKAREYFEKALEKIGDNGANYNMTDDIYLQLLYILGSELDVKNKEDRDRMMDICDKGLSFDNGRNDDLREYKGWLLMNDGQTEESLKVFLDLEKKEDHTAYVDYQIGRLYYKDLSHKAREARDHFLKALEKGYDHGGDFYVGICELYMNHPDAAEQAFMNLKEKEPDSVDPYERLISVYQMKNDLDKALEYADKLLEVSKYEDDGYYIEKVQILRMRKEYDEAVNLLKEVGKKFKRPVNKRIFDVYMEAGQYKEAEKHLNKWLLMGNIDGDYYQCQIVLNILKGDFKKARHIYGVQAKRLSDWSRNLYGHLLALEEEDFVKDEDILLKWKEELKDPRPDQLASIYEYLAFNAFYRNDTEKQHMYAEKALEENEKDLQEYSMYKLLYMTRKYRILSLLGRKEEAEELAQKIRKTPLCDNCQYCRCKDQEVFEMDAAELNGDYEKALELARKGREEWTAEEDFAIALSRLERKVKR